MAWSQTLAASGSVIYTLWLNYRPAVGPKDLPRHFFGREIFDMRQLSFAESSSPQTAHDVGTTPHQVPQKIGSIVFNHHDDWSLIECKVPGCNPTVRLRTFVRIGGVKRRTKAVGISFGQTQIIEMSNCRQDDFRRKWQGRH